MQYFKDVAHYGKPREDSKRQMTTLHHEYQVPGTWYVALSREYLHQSKVSLLLVYSIEFDLYRKNDRMLLCHVIGHGTTAVVDGSLVPGMRLGYGLSAIMICHEQEASYRYTFLGITPTPEVSTRTVTHTCYHVIRTTTLSYQL